MDNRILSGLIAEYELTRQQNAQEEDRRKQEIAALHPDLAALTEKRHEMVLSSMRSLFAAPGTADPEKIMEEYNQKISALLLKKGYPADYLSPIHSCEKCRDTGYYYDDSSRRQMCPCLQKAYHAALSEDGCGMEPEQTFENFDLSRFPADSIPGSDISQREYMDVIRKKCLAYAEKLPYGPLKTLLLHGGSGLGKTYLLHCIEREGAAMGIGCVFCTAYDVLDALRQRYFGRENDLADAIENAQLLLIDDLGMEPLMENITVEQIYHLLSTRLSRGLYTAISTNLSRTELQKRYTERVSSRLLDVRSGMAIPFRGEDIRLKK